MTRDFASLLGETYRSTEAALKELVDNAWDADTEHVWITLPAAMTQNPIIVRDDGDGMSSEFVRAEYLMVARDRRSRKGQRSQRLKRRIKGRKGIGKFAGLAAAQLMRVETVCNARRTIVTIDKAAITNADSDLERIPLPLAEEEAAAEDKRTTITLSNLNQALDFPNEERLRALLVHEYGREHSITIYVNNRPLDVEDVPGETKQAERKLSQGGEAQMRFTVADGTKSPRHPGIVLKVSGKVVGRPQWFGLEDDPELPPKLLKRLYGVVEVEGIDDDLVTSDWGAVIENSKAYNELSEFVRSQARDALDRTFSRDINLQRARLQQEINRRIELLPEHRREFAEAAVGRVLLKFYGEREDRVVTAASVVLDAMERDEYWEVLRAVDEARNRDVATFAEALEKFGLLELALMSERAAYRMGFLDRLDALAADRKTLEQQMHQAMEKSSWVFGSKYHLMASNVTLKRIIEEYTGRRFQGEKAKRRPDLLLSTDPSDRYLLIEFKRPSHEINRQDEAQAQDYRDQLGAYLPAKPMDVILIGGTRDAKANAANDPPNFAVKTYSDVIAQARFEVDWLVKNSSE